MTCIATYNIQILEPERDWPAPYATQNTFDQNRINARLLSNLPAMLEAVEEDLTSLLPPGYSARIREWSSDE